MTTAGPNSPAAAVDDGSQPSGARISWSSATNVYTSNNQNAEASTAQAGRYTYYLRATDFGFNIPGGATLDGIKVDVECSAPNGAQVYDQSVRLYNTGYTGSDKQKGAFDYWQAYSDGIRTYGGATDMWGTSLTPEAVNASTFGVGISAYVNQTSQATEATIDHITITIYYSGSGSQCIVTSTLQVV